MEKLKTPKRKKRFIRYKSVNQVKLKGGWPRLRGIHNKVRLKKKGHIHKVSIGYGTKKEARNLYNSLFDYKFINNLKDMDNIACEYILISKSIGMKKKIEILKKAKKMNLKIINIKDIDMFLKNVESKKTEDKESKKKKHEKKEEAKKKAEEKLKDKKEITQEQKSDIEKEEKKKLLEGK